MTRVISMKRFMRDFLLQDDFSANYITHKELKSFKLAEVKVLPASISEEFPDIFMTGLALKVIDCNNEIEIYKRPFAKAKEEFEFIPIYEGDEETEFDFFHTQKYEGINHQLKLGGKNGKY